MLESIKGTSGKVLLAALAGVSAGIIAGLLMAPETGRETRQGLSRGANDLSAIVNRVIARYTGKPETIKSGKPKKKHRKKAHD